MATTEGIMGFTGSMGNVTAYRMKGVDRIILRSKGRVSRSRIKRHPNYDLTRRNNEEWKACVSSGKNIRRAMGLIRRLADYNFSGPLHALCKHIQLDDKVNDKGKRSVLISQSPYKLEGFGLNKYNTFDSILRHPLNYSLDRNTGTANISLPDIIPGINLHNPLKQPMFRILFLLGMVSDIVYDEERRMYRPVADGSPGAPLAFADTSWHNWKDGSAATSLNISLSNWRPEEGVSLVLSAGVEFGVPVSQNEVQIVKYSGAGKVLKVG